MLQHYVLPGSGPTEGLGARNLADAPVIGKNGKCAEAQSHT